jgi:hypothetical protein
VSLLSLLQAPSSIVAQLTDIPASAISEFESPKAWFAYAQAVLENEPWVQDVPSDQWSWIVSQAYKDYTIVRQIESLQIIQISKAMVSLSASASLESQTFTTTFTDLDSVFTTTVFPAPTHVFPPENQNLPLGAQLGIGLGMAAFVVFWTGGWAMWHSRKNRIRAVQPNDAPAPQEVDPQSPIILFPKHNEQDSTAGTTFAHGDGPIELVELKGENGVSSYVQVTPIDSEPAEDSRKNWSVTNEAGEPVYQTGAQNSVSDTNAPNVIKRKPVGSVSSRGVVSMEGHPSSEQVGATAGGYMSGAEDSKNGNEDSTDAVEMPSALTIGERTQQGSSSDSDEKVEGAA